MDTQLSKVVTKMLMQAPKEQQSTLLLLFVGAIQDAMKGNDVEATAVMWNGSLFIFKIELFWELRVNIWKQWAHNKSVVYLSLSLNYYICSLQVYTVFKGQKLKDSMRHFITSKTVKSLLKTKQNASKYWTTQRKDWFLICGQPVASRTFF